MIKMGFVYKDIGRTKNLAETCDIKEKRKKSLQGLRAAENEAALIIYLDESYCNQNHVSNKGWFILGDVV
ncbi:hypothetical protein BGZ83_001084, partial [Gryganskiella cystojenkinii]